jgi:hypothetical protein
MPIVPLYDSPQVGQAAMPNATQDLTSAYHATEGAALAGKQSMQFGQAIEGLGDEFAKENIQHQIELNTVDAKTADVTFTTQATQQVQAWKANANGMNARQTQKDVLSGLKDTYQNTLTELQKTNPGAVEAFTLQAQARMGDMQNQINGHVLEQDNLAIKGASLARAEMQAGLAVSQKSDPVAFKGAVDIGLNEIKSTAAREYGADNKDMINAAVLKYTTGINKETISSYIAEGNAGAANEFLKNHWTEIDPLQRAEIEKTVKSFNDTTVANTYAHDLFTSKAPAIDSKESVNIYDMEKDIHDKFKDNPEQEKLAISAVRDQFTSFNQQRTGMATDAGAKVYDLLSSNRNMTASQLRSTPEWLNLEKLNPQLADGMLDHADQRQYTNTVKASAIEARNDASEARKQRQLEITNYGSYLDYSNIDKLNSMSESDIKNLLPVLGNQLTGDLMNKKRSIVKTDAKVIDAKVDEDDFNTIVSGIGLNPYDTKNITPEQKATIGKLKYTVENAIDLQQQGTGKPITRQEKQQLMKSIVDDSVMKDNGFWSSDTSVPAALVKQDDMEKVYTKVGDEKVYAKDIPQSFVQSAIKQRPNASSSDIAKAWVKSRGKWSKPHSLADDIPQ